MQKARLPLRLTPRYLAAGLRAVASLIRKVLQALDVRGESERRRSLLFRRFTPFVLMGLAAGGCGDRDAPAEDGRTLPPGTRRMAARLDSLASNVDRESFLYANSRRIEDLLAVEPPANPLASLELRVALAEERLFAGRIEEAIDDLQQILVDARPGGGGLSPGRLRAIAGLLAIAYMRLAERDNCLGGPGTPACLVPIGPEGVHVDQRGARAAGSAYRAILAQEPSDLGARWMINVAAMMVGEHPEGVPDHWLIPARAFESEHDVRPFRDVARPLGLDVVSRAGGSIMDDFDGDGTLDIVASSWGLRDPLRYFRSRGDGTFRDAGRDAGLTGIVGGLNLLQADYDNDGWLDILVLRGGWLPTGHPNSLLRNLGDGTFEDVTEAAGLLSPTPTQTACWADFDNDGWLDLFVGNESWGGRRHPSQLFRNNGDGTFSDLAADARAMVFGIVKAVVCGDVDNDGWVDVFVSRRGDTNVLLRNLGVSDSALRFADESGPAGVGEPIDSFPAWFWDYDNDGWLDIFVAGYRSGFGDVAAELLGLPHGAELPRLYRNDGDGTFTDVTQEARLDRILFAMGANFGDFDNDGWLDFYVGTGDMDVRALLPNRAFRNAGGRYFQEVTSSGSLGLIQKGHGVSFGDLDNDGDQDIYVEMGGAYEGDLAANVLFENPGHGNRWLTLRLEGTRANRSAIGARIRVSVETADGMRHIHSVVSSGGSFGASSLQQEIGLGQTTAIRAVRVTWPGTAEAHEFGDLELNTVYRIREGDPAPTALPTKSFRLAAP